MPVNTAPTCSILLLAGGRGQRMGGADKGLLDWQGKPMIAWLYEQVRPLTDDLIISCNRNQERYAAYADQLAEDAEDGFQGPLAGIRAGLKIAKHDHLLILPCDAPRLDHTLLSQLLSSAADLPIVLREGEQWHPLFSLIPRSLLPTIEEAWLAGQRSPQRLLRQLHARTLICPINDPRLANLNTPELLTTTYRHSGN